VQYPAIYWAYEVLNGKITMLNLVLIVISLPLGPMVQLLAGSENVRSSGDGDVRNGMYGTGLDMITLNAYVEADKEYDPLIQSSRHLDFDSYGAVVVDHYDHDHHHGEPERYYCN